MFGPDTSPIPRVPKLATTSEVAQILRVPKHRIEYLLRTRTHIRPRATAGRSRCFDENAITQLRHELNAIAAKGGVV